MFDEGLAELHTHLGGSVASDILWSLAHEQGIALPVKDYWEFDALVTVSDPRGVENLDALDRIYHWTELIQSSPLAVERSVHGAIGGAYRSQRITTLELRFNPMKRNRGGERDLDHIILAAIRGLDRAALEYPQVRAGLILMMDRTFARAERDRRREGDPLGLARRRRRRHRRPAAGRRPLRLHADRADGRDGARRRARRHDPRRRGGRRPAREEIREVVEHLRPDRIGHGILAARDPELMRLLREPGSCSRSARPPTCSRRRSPDEEAVRDTFRAFVDHDVAFTIATDGPEMMHTHLRDELELLERIGALDGRRARDREPPRPRGQLHRRSLDANLTAATRAPRVGVRVDMAAPAPWKLLDRALDRLPGLGLDLPRDQDLGRTLPAFLSAGSRFLLAGGCSPDPLR